MRLSCRDKNVIYVAQFSICTGSNLGESTYYFGQTTTEVRQRFNGHRSKFKFDADKSYTKSALSQHCFNEDPESMNLMNFKVAFVKKCPAIEIDREKHRLISIFRTNSLGINRIKVIR